MQELFVHILEVFLTIIATGVANEILKRFGIGHEETTLPRQRKKGGSSSKKNK